MHRRRKRDAQLALDVGRRISILMERVHVARLDLAPQIGISASTLWDYINGVSLPGLEVLLKIANYFSVPIDWLLKGESSYLPFRDDTMILAEKIEDYLKKHPDDTERLKGLIDLYTSDYDCAHNGNKN